MEKFDIFHFFFEIMIFPTLEGKFFQYTQNPSIFPTLTLKQTKFAKKLVCKKNCFAKKIAYFFWVEVPSRAEPGCASLLRHLKVERQRGKRGIFFFDTRFDSVGIEKKLRCCFHESHKATEMIPSVRLFIPTIVAEICQWSQMVPCSFVPVQSSMTALHCPHGCSSVLCQTHCHGWLHRDNGAQSWMTAQGQRSMGPSDPTDRFLQQWWV